VDRALAGAGVAARVVGGYYAGDRLLVSLDRNVFVGREARQAAQRALGARAVEATVGVLMVDGWKLPPPVETMDVLALMALHQAEREYHLAAGFFEDAAQVCERNTDN
jgi:hypothetical protein